MQSSLVLFSNNFEKFHQIMVYATMTHNVWNSDIFCSISQSWLISTLSSTFFKSANLFEILHHLASWDQIFACQTFVLLIYLLIASPWVLRLLNNGEYHSQPYKRLDIMYTWLLSSVCQHIISVIVCFFHQEKCKCIYKLFRVGTLYSWQVHFLMWQNLLLWPHYHY